jgi:hypothetical protein
VEEFSSVLSSFLSCGLYFRGQEIVCRDLRFGTGFSSAYFASFLM